MPVTPAFCPLSTSTLRDANDARIIGGYIYAYAAGTTQLITTYADAGMSAANPNPLRTDGFGRIPKIYLGLGAYKLVLQDASRALIDTIDGLPGGIDYDAKAAAAAQNSAAALAGAVTGDVKFKHGWTSDAGWLWLNGLTIGNGASQGVARANDDTRNLFIYLWNVDGSLAVSGGRGVTATADFTANKTIALPDYRGRMVAGCDKMGAPSAAGRITAATSATPDAPGSTFGVEMVTLSQAQLPAVAPTITVAAAGGHTHTGSAQSAGSHNHGGTTNTTGAHTHKYTATNYNNGAGAGGAVGNTDANLNAQTGSAGDHSHTITVDGAHTHVLAVDAVADHAHTATASPIGSGQAHSNMPPAILGYWHIKL